MILTALHESVDELRSDSRTAQAVWQLWRRCLAERVAENFSCRCLTKEPACGQGHDMVNLLWERSMRSFRFDRAGQKNFL
jgi:hypothetical protein